MKKKMQQLSIKTKAAALIQSRENKINIKTMAPSLILQLRGKFLLYCLQIRHWSEMFKQQ